MCGRYALALWPRQVRRHLEDSHMPSQEAPDDDEPHLRQSYNFAPGYYGLVYRADVPDYGAGGRPNSQPDNTEDGPGSKTSADNAPGSQSGGKEPRDIPAPERRYKIQAMQWGLIPFWTKRNPGYGSMMKTINCRDDSLATSGGMWTTMKQRKRCIVVAQGFYEWLKKDGGKTKIPHYTKRKDGQLMCFAGLWDCVQYEDSAEKLYTYTIITTDSNKQLNFLHDRMPVILENGSEEMFTWLDSSRSEWSRELQSLLKPYAGELECYPVSKDVGKVGNNSPTFIVPVDSAQNKQNIANFFGNQKKKAAPGTGEEAESQQEQQDVEREQINDKIGHQVGETRDTGIEEVGDSNAPKPLASTKRNRSASLLEDDEADTSQHKAQKTKPTASPTKFPSKTSTPAKKTRSATSNGTKSPTASGDGSKKITSFFK